MQYMVQVEGKVSNPERKVYLINSNSLQEAEELATESFSDEFNADVSSLGVRTQKRTFKAIMSLLIMIIPIFLSFIEWKSGHNTISINPDYISCFYAVILYASFVIRFKGIQRTASSVYDILFCVFLVAMFSSFLRLIITTHKINILGLKEIDINTTYLVAGIIILSWIGLKFVSLLCLAATTFLALSNIIALNEAMGPIWGPVYVLASFISLLLYFSIEPAIYDTFSSIKRLSLTGRYHLLSDINIEKNKLSGMVKEIKSKKGNNDKNNKDEGEINGR